MRKILVLVLVLVIMFFMFGCGEKAKTDKGLVVSPSVTSVSAQYLKKGQLEMNLAGFTFINNSDKSAIVTEISLERTGISTDSALTGIYLFEGSKKLMVSEISTGQINFYKKSGIFTVPARSSITIIVKADIAKNTKDKSIALNLKGVMASIPVQATFPPYGPTINIM